MEASFTVPSRDPARGQRWVALIEVLAVCFVAVLAPVFVVLPWLFLDGTLNFPMEPSDVEGLIVGKFREVMTVQVLVFSLIAGAMIVWRVDRTRTRPFVLGPIVGWGLLGGLLAVGANLVFGLVLGALGVEIKEQEALAKLLGDRALLISAAPWIVLFVPFAEELLFRGYVFRYLDQQINRTAALFVSCGVFALIHGNLTGIPSYVAVALVFAWVYIKTDSLLAPILAHAVQNGIIVLAAFVTGGTPPP